jgi:hypothetical protein
MIQRKQIQQQAQIETQVKTAISNYAKTSLNTFNSTLMLSDFSMQIDSVN